MNKKGTETIIVNDPSGRIIVKGKEIVNGRYKKDSPEFAKLRPLVGKSKFVKLEV